MKNQKKIKILVVCVSFHMFDHKIYVNLIRRNFSYHHKEMKKKWIKKSWATETCSTSNRAWIYSAFGMVHVCLFAYIY